jgi:DNA transformation protein
MASRQSTADFILEQIAEAGAVSAKKMFGEYAVYCDEKVVGFICNDQLFVKPTAAGKEFIGDFVEGFPYPRAKPHLLISGEKWDDNEWLTHLISVSAEQLPLPKKKSRSDKG